MQSSTQVRATLNVASHSTTCTSAPSLLTHEQLNVIQEEFIRVNAEREIQFKQVLEKGPLEVPKAKDQESAKPLLSCKFRCTT